MEELEEVEVEYCRNCSEEIDDCQCCGDCGEYPCCCCDNCGYSSCECCSDCENYPCTCNDGHGTSETAPWVQRGEKIKRARNRTDKWSEVWPEIDTKIDPVIAAADFYLLEALTSNAVFDFKPVPSPVLSTQEENDLLDLLGIFELKDRRSFLRDRSTRVQALLASSPEIKASALVDQADLLQRALVDKLDASFVAYVHVAVAGEVRHHRAIGGLHLDSDRDIAWAGWRDIYESVGNQALLDIADLFEEFDNDAYGGPKWASAAKILYNRLESALGPNEYVNKKLFVDRVFSMQHNGGQLLNKIEWKVNNIKKAAVGYLPTVLDHHASEPPDIMFLYRMASREVQHIFRSLMEAGLAVRPEFGKTAEDFMKLIDADPFYICRQCGSNAKLGHYYSCKYVKYLRDYVMRDKDGNVVFNNEYFQMRWDAADLGYAFHETNYPCGPLAEKNILPDTNVVVKVDGYWSASKMKDSKSVSFMFQAKAGDLQTIDFRDYGYDPAQHGEINGYNIAWTIEVEGIPNNVYFAKASEAWNAQHYYKNLNYGGFVNKFVQMDIKVNKVSSKIKELSYTIIEDYGSGYGPYTTTKVIPQSAFYVDYAQMISDKTISTILNVS